MRYAGAIPATGGVVPRTWSVAAGALPAGLTLNPATGAITGVPRAAGAFALTFTVTDAAGQRATVASTLRIASRLAVTTAGLRAAAVGASYRVKLRSSGGVGAKQWRILGGPPPSGLRLDPNTGTLSGTPRQAGVYRLRI